MNMIKKVFQDGFFIASSVFACVIVFRGVAWVMAWGMKWDISSYPGWVIALISIVSIILIAILSFFVCIVLIFLKHRSEKSEQEGGWKKFFGELDEFIQKNFSLPNGKTSLRFVVIVVLVLLGIAYFVYMELAKHGNEEIVFNGRSQPCIVKLDISQIESISKNGEVKIKVNFEKNEYFSKEAKSTPVCKILD